MTHRLFKKIAIVQNLLIHPSGSKEYNMQKRFLGIAITAIGIVMILYTGFNYKTTEKVVDLGPIKINAEKNHPVKWSPVVGVVLVIGGVVFMAIDKRIQP